MILDEKKVRIFESFLLNTELKVTASQIAKKQNLNQKSVSLFLSNLEGQGILKSEFQGKNKLYFLNKENKELLKHFLLLTEHFRTLLFYEKYPKIKIIISKIIPHVKGTLVLFGSYANGTSNSKSDLDLFIIGKYDKKVDEILEDFNIEINIKHQNKFSKNTLTKEIKKNHILLSNFEEYILEENKWIN